ncbi:DinB family protein [Saccharopolyspora sp. NPDC049357]|uniref:DinB family protein n=1 Tax=Saccharopolyspora sp. NPDC049357 TaxID=3154507 RepID=UPI00342B74DE
MCESPQVDRQALHEEMERARASFHELLSRATEAELARLSKGTRWTNEQLLFHMLFGYMIVRNLVILVRVFGRLPAGVSRGFAALLNASTRPFDAVNYWGSCGGPRVFGPDQMAAKMDRVINGLHRRLDAEREADLRRGMHYPTRWDPFFADFMTLADVYHFPTQHFGFHRRQLTLDGAG